jgi:hypothetical protein
MHAALHWVVLIVVIVACAVDILYVSQIVGPPGGRGYSLPWRSVFVALFIAAMTIAAALAIRPSATGGRTVLLGLSSVGLLAMGYLAIFSVGLPLLVAGLGLLVALIYAVVASRQPAGVMRAAAGGLLALVIFFGGFELTAQAITCPAHGFEGGTGSSFFGGPYHYTCVDGKLTIRPGECSYMGASMDPSGHVIAVSDC